MKESEKAAVDLFELSRLTILVRKLKGDQAPVGILEGLSARIDKMRVGIDPETLSAFDSMSAFAESEGADA
jgi:hypothetical protein